jgi:3-methyladenine DNA glycosylase AlkD
MPVQTDIPDRVQEIVAAYDPSSPGRTAEQLQELWLQLESKSIAGIKAEQREQQETVGIAIPALKAIGKEVGKVACKRVDGFVPLARVLWEEFGREGRVIALLILGPMELSAPATIIPVLHELCRTCITWEDADRLAIDALEPIVRKKPEQWLAVIEPWLSDDNKWIRRAGVTVIGRLPMKHAEYTPRCVELAERLLLDDDMDVKRAVSFAFRIAARGAIAPVVDFLTKHVPPQNPAATWVLCDVIRSMGNKLLPEFVPLLPRYQQWADAPTLSTKDRRSVESAVSVLRNA